MSICLAGVRKPLIECFVNDTGAAAEYLPLQQESVTQNRANLNLLGRCYFDGHIVGNNRSRDEGLCTENYLSVDVRHFFLWSWIIVNRKGRGAFGPYPVQHFLHQLETLETQLARIVTLLQNLANA
ncbi:MAG: hypothetical protein ACE5FV_07840 [Woeseia sp.]